MNWKWEVYSKYMLRCLRVLGFVEMMAEKDRLLEKEQ